MVNRHLAIAHRNRFLSFLSYTRRARAAARRRIFGDARWYRSCWIRTCMAKAFAWLFLVYFTFLHFWIFAGATHISYMLLRAPRFAVHAATAHAPRICHALINSLYRAARAWSVQMVHRPSAYRSFGRMLYILFSDRTCTSRQAGNCCWVGVGR